MFDHLHGTDKDFKQQYLVMQEGGEEEGSLVKLLKHSGSDITIPHTADMLMNTWENSFTIVGTQNRALYAGPNEDSTYLVWTSKPYVWYQQSGYSISSNMDGSGICWSTPGTSVQLAKCGEGEKVVWFSERLGTQ